MSLHRIALASTLLLVSCTSAPPSHAPTHEPPDGETPWVKPAKAQLSSAEVAQLRSRSITPDVHDWTPVLALEHGLLTTELGRWVGTDIARVHSGDATLAFSLGALRVEDENGRALASTPPQPVEATVSDFKWGEVKYRAAYVGATLELRTTLHRVEEALVLDELPEMLRREPNAATLAFESQLTLPEGMGFWWFDGDDWTQVSTSEAGALFETRDAIGIGDDAKDFEDAHVPMHIPAVTAHDASGAEAPAEARVIIPDNGGRPVLATLVGADWLRHPDRVYPVTIDPPVRAGRPSATSRRRVRARLRRGELTITGTAGDDSIIVRHDNGRPARLIVDDLRTRNPRDFRFRLNRIESISASLGDGNDRIILDDSGGPISERFPTELVGGGGDDELVLTTGGHPAEDVIPSLGLFSSLQRISGEIDAMEREVLPRLLEEHIALALATHDEVVAPAMGITEEVDALLLRAEALVGRAQDDLGGTLLAPLEEGAESLLARAEAVREAQSDEIIPAVEALTAEAQQISEQAVALLNDEGERLLGPVTDEFVVRLDSLMDAADDLDREAERQGSDREPGAARVDAAMDAFERRLDDFSALVASQAEEPGLVLYARSQRELLADAEALAARAETEIVATAEELSQYVDEVYLPAAEGVEAQATRLGLEGERLAARVAKDVEAPAYALQRRAERFIEHAQGYGQRFIDIGTRAQEIAARVGRLMGDTLGEQKTHLGQTCPVNATNIVAGTGGNDTLWGGATSDLITGGAGDDWLIGFGAADDLQGGDGVDWMFGGGGADQMTGGMGDDRMFGMAGNDCMFGNEDRDWMFGDFIFGAPGTDAMEGNEDRDRMFGMGEDDDMHGDEDSDFMMGNAGNDEMLGGAGEFNTSGAVVTNVGDIMLGNDGTDTMEGEGGMDIMSGDADADDMEGGPQADIMLGFGDTDEMRGQGGGGITVSGFPLFFLGNFMMGNDAEDQMWGGFANDIMLGNDANDEMRGGFLADIMFGGPGQDEMRGQLGPDLMGGNDDTDDMNGGWGPDFMIGGPALDIMRGNLGPDFMLGNDGPDDMNGGWGPDFMIGGPGTDTMRGNLGPDFVLGGDDSDDMDGGWGPDFMFGQEDADLMRGNLGPDFMWGGPGADTMDGNFGFDFMWGGRGGDVMDGGWLGDWMWGMRGSDVMRGNQGNDKMWGGKQPDQMWGNTFADLMFGDKCDDEMFGGPGPDMMFGGKDEDTMFGEGGPDFMSGDKHDDTMSGGTGFDFMLGGNGEDDMRGDSGGDMMFGNRAMDVMRGGDGPDWMGGGRAGDLMFGNAGLDFMAGGKGDDAMDGEEGSDFMLGGKGNDWMEGRGGFDFMFGGKGDDAMRGGNNTDLMWGNRGRDDMHGNASGDLMWGGRDEDRVYGEGGNDFVRGGKHDDSVYGGDGNDWVKGKKGNDKLCGDANRDHLKGKRGDDRMNGGPERDWLRGNRGNDTMFGEGGNDVMRGRAHDDDMSGGDGDDRMFGNRHDDRMQGDDGEDRMRGRRHDDTIHGGNQDDNIKGNLGTDACDGGAGSNTVNCENSAGAPATFVGVNAAEIRGVKFNDVNGNGVRDANEPTIPGVWIYIDVNNNNVLDTGEPSAITKFDQPNTALDETGMYAFFDLPAGTYVVRELVPPGFFATTPPGGVITLELGDCEVVELNFGDRELCRPTADGLGCVQDGCVDDGGPPGVCAPKCVLFNEQDPDRPYQILDCDCGPQDACHVVFDAAGQPSCEGTCGLDESCEGTWINIPFTHQRIFCCGCAGGTICAPAADAQSCEPSAECAASGGQCDPTCVNWDPDEGVLLVEECSCQNAGSCSVDIDAPGGPACGGGCPPGFSCVTQEKEGCLGEGDDICCTCGADDCQPTPDRKSCEEHICPDPEQTCIPTEMEVNFFCEGGPFDGAPCAVTPDCLGGLCKPEYEVVTCTCMDPEDCHVEFDENIGAYCGGDCPEDSDECELQVAGNIYSCGCEPGGCAEKDDLSGCNGAPCDDPDLRCVPQEIAVVDTCVGGTTPGIACTTDADCDGGGTCEATPLTLDCECSDECHVIWDDASEDAACTGGCPVTGDICVRDEDDNTFSCDCETPECEPTDDATGCESFNCPNGIDQCKPTAITVIEVCQGGSLDGLLCNDDSDCPGGICAEEESVEDCDCLDPSECHIDLDPTTSPGRTCVSPCPDTTQSCNMINDLGTYECDCEDPPPPACVPTPDGRDCEQIACVDPSAKCVPIVMEIVLRCIGGVNDGLPCTANPDCPGGFCREGPNVKECDCLTGGACHVQWNPSIVMPDCTGICPAPTTCTLGEVAGDFSCSCQ